MSCLKDNNFVWMEGDRQLRGKGIGLLIDLLGLIIILYSFNFTTTFDMGYNRFVQVGRVARVSFGPEEGKLATIVDIISDKRVLIDGQSLKRQVIPIKRLQLTSQVIGVLRGAKSQKVKAIIKKENVAKKYAGSAIGKAYSRQARRESLTDFERYKVLVLRRKLAKLTRAKVSKKK